MKESFEIGLDWFHAAHVGVNNNMLALQKRESEIMSCLMFHLLCL